MNISEKSVIYTSTAKMQEICSPLLANKKISYFEYVRLNKDGTALKLDTAQNVLPYILGNDLYLKPDEIEEFNSHIFMSSSLPKLNNTILVDVISDYREYFNLDHFFFLVKEKIDYIEVFVYGTDRDNHKVINYYLNNIDVMDVFSIYFIDKGRDLISVALKEKIIFKEWQDFFKKRNQNNQNSDSVDLHIPKHLYFINEKKAKEVAISYREFQCVTKYLSGKSSKTIAKELNLSPRTIESHILNFRKKLNCTTKNEMMALLDKNGYKKFLSYGLK